jgi:hypothetical protein
MNVRGKESKELGSTGVSLGSIREKPALLEGKVPKKCTQSAGKALTWKGTKHSAVL